MSVAPPRNVTIAEIEALQAGLHDDAGVDLSQVDRMLALTPRERLQALEASVESLCEVMRRAGRHPNP